MAILITGGAGFIGSHLVRHLVKTYPHYTIVNLDALTYAADPTRLDDVKDPANYRFIEWNIHDSSVVEEVMTWLDLAKRLFSNQEVLGRSGANSPVIRPKKVVLKNNNT